MSPEVKIRRYWKENPQRFIEDYWKIIDRKIRLMRWIFGGELFLMDLARVYRKSIFWEWRLMTLDEFVEEFDRRKL